jgi:hypothetical protein
MIDIHFSSLIILITGDITLVRPFTGKYLTKKLFTHDLREPGEHKS